MLGFLLAALGPGALAAIVGFALVGLGAANVVPALFGAAGHGGELSASSALAVVSVFGYGGSLGGPPMVGLVAAHTSLAFGLGVVAAAVCGIVAGASLVRRAAPGPGP